MRKNDWTVKDEGIRPAGSINKCFYCSIKKGGTHKQDCVVRQRTVVVKMEIDILLSVPEHWDEYTFNDARNDSSYCASNIIDDLERMDKKMGCLCDVAKFKYLREATEADEEKFQLFAKDLPQ